MPLTRSQSGKEPLCSMEPNQSFLDSKIISSDTAASEPAIKVVSSKRNTASKATVVQSDIARSIKTHSKVTHSTRSNKSLQLQKLAVEEELAQAAVKLAQVKLKRLELQEEDSSEDDVDVEKELVSETVEEWLDEVVENNSRTSAGDCDQKQPHIQHEERFESPKRNTQLGIQDLASAIIQAVKSVPNKDPPRYLQELPIFNGNGADWLAFQAAFRDTAYYFSTTENVARLRRSLRGVAREAVQSQLLSDPGPEKILEILKRRFGRPDTLVLVEIEKLKKMVKTNDNPRELCIFASRIASSVATIEALGKQHYLHNPELTRDTIEKLPITLRYRWYDYAAIHREDIPEVIKISQFLNAEVDKCGPFAQAEVIQEEGNFYRKRTERSFIATVEEKNIKCPHCEEDHQLADCIKFKCVSVDERIKLAKKYGICFRCLKSRHRRTFCKAKTCGVPACEYKHHRLLHADKKTETMVVATNNCIPSHPRAYLKIIPVVLSGPRNTVEVFALLDEGSTITMIDASIAELLGADGPSVPMCVSGISGTKMDLNHSKRVNLKVRGKHQQQQHDLVGVRTVDNMSFPPQTVQQAKIETCNHLKDILDEIIYDSGTPTLLIGQDNWSLIVSREIKAGRRGQPVASLTDLGWVLHGFSSSATQPVNYCGYVKTTDDEVDDMVKQYFQLESLGIEARKPKSDPEEKALAVLETTSKRISEDRFETGLLWKKEDMKLPNNYDAAMRRLITLEKKLDREPTLKKKYALQLQHLIDNNYAEEINTPAPVGKTWYLPHFAVVNPAKEKIRIVHDAAAKAHGVSLNDHLLSGPDLLQSLPGVLMRFRQYPVAVMADVREMFLQVRIRAEDRDALRFLWRDEDRQGKPKEYRMTSVIFGACSSPCTALFIKNKNAKEHAEQFPEAAEAIIKNHYMDDYLKSFFTMDEAKKVSREVDFIHKRAGFELRSWTSNKEEFLQDIPPDKRSSKRINLGGYNHFEKTLGLQWDTQEDCLIFNVKTGEDREEVPTKRKALSIIMALFDPLGLITPVTTPAKRLMQETWKVGVKWDEPLPEELLRRWREWQKHLLKLKSLKIPRCYGAEIRCQHELHTFVDSSEEAYAASVYWRFQCGDGSIKVVLVAAKSRVTPLKPVSIPRLELQAALLGSRLAASVQQEQDFTPDRRFFWTDSTTILAWIRGDPRSFKTFVAHRLAEIEDLTKTNEWRWVPTKQNVADDATRETPPDFSETHRWFRGPTFLYEDSQYWPQEKKSKVEKGNSNIDEEKEMVSVTLLIEVQDTWLPNIERFSSWIRLIRATARILQFIELIKTKKAPEIAVAGRHKRMQNKRKDPAKFTNKKKFQKIPSQQKKEPQRVYIPLEARHLQAAEEAWVKRSQKESFKEEIQRVKKKVKPTKNDRLANLFLILDNKEILRINSRISRTQDISEEQRYPAILDGRHAYSKLYIRHVHQQMHHAGVETVVNELRQRFWMLRIRPTVREVVKTCLHCCIRRKNPSTPITGDHPAARLAHHTRPFSFVGLDYFGQIEITVKRSHEKRYVALFTCLTSRAIHLEVAASLSTDSAISALRRMMARRGCPTEIYSDNGTNFKGTVNELSDALNGMREEATTKQIHWRFIPPGAPFMGGAWERMVRSVKEALRAVLNEKYPNKETLRTLLTEVENTVNSRPLTHVSVDPEDPEALTPNHLLLGAGNKLPAGGEFTDADLKSKHMWKRAQRLADIFWQRWVQEYLPTLQYRREVRIQRETPKIGDVVLIIDSNLPRNTWPKGIISETYPGKDGVIRVVDVTTAGGKVFRRATKKIVILK